MKNKDYAINKGSTKLPIKVRCLSINWLCNALALLCLFFLIHWANNLLFFFFFSPISIFTCQKKNKSKFIYYPKTVIVELKQFQTLLYGKMGQTKNYKYLLWMKKLLRCSSYMNGGVQCVPKIYWIQ